MQIRFEFDTEHGIYRDALNLPEDHAFSEAELEAMKQARLDAWLRVINSPNTEE